MADPKPRRDRLRTELARVRVKAGLSGRALGAALGDGLAVKQATISRIERGQTVPSVPTVRAWLAACRVDDAAAAALLDLAEAAQAETRGWRELLERDGHAQREAADMEEAATAVRNFQPSVVPGLLQTPAYARALLTIGHTRDVDRALSSRIGRQQILYEPGRLFTFLIAEKVLTWPLGGPDVLVGQRDWIVSLARLDTVEVAVLPHEATVTALWNNFLLWTFADEPARVTVERTDGETDTNDSGTVAHHLSLWERMWGAALLGDDARDFIRTLP